MTETAPKITEELLKAEAKKLISECLIGEALLENVSIMLINSISRGHGEYEKALVLRDGLTRLIQEGGNQGTETESEFYTQYKIISGFIDGVAVGKKIAIDKIGK